MIDYRNFEDYAYLASVFTRLYHFDSNIVMSGMYDKFRNLFDDDILSIPLPEGAPQDLPRVIMKSKNKIWQIDFSNLRVNLRAQLKYDENKDIGLKGFLGTALEIFSKYKDIVKINYGRIAIVVERNFQYEKPGLELVKHFCKDKWINSVLNRPERFELHAYKHYRINDEFPEINSWIRHKGKVEKIDNDRIIGTITLEQDLNTPQEKTNTEDYNIQKIKNYFEVVPIQMEDLIKQYYPISE